MESILKKLQKKVGASLVSERSYLINYFSKRAEKYNFKSSEPRIYLIPSKHNATVSAAYVNAGGRQDSDFSNSLALTLNAVVVIFVEPGMSNLDIVSLLFHELDHLYCLKSIVPIPVKNKNNEIRSYQGYFFEEGFVSKEEEFYVTHRAKLLFKDDYILKTQKMAALRKELEEKSLPSPKTYVSYIFTDLGTRMSLVADNFVRLHSLIECKIPSWMDLIIEARLTGDWKNLETQTDEQFGGGTFKMLFQITRENYSENMLKELLNKFSHDE